jgi:hypothetical protein
MPRTELAACVTGLAVPAAGLIAVPFAVVALIGGIWLGSVAALLGLCVAAFAVVDAGWIALPPTLAALAAGGWLSVARLRSR